MIITLEVHIQFNTYDLSFQVIVSICPRPFEKMQSVEIFCVDNRLRSLYLKVFWMQFQSFLGYNVLSIIVLNRLDRTRFRRIV